MPTTIHIVKARIFPAVMWELGHEDDWAPKNSHFQTMVLEKTLESHLHSKEIKPVSSKGNEPSIFIGTTDAEAETSSILATLCKEPTHWKRSWCWERLRARGEGGDRGQLVGWHHWLNGHEFEQTAIDGEGEGSLVCCRQWGLKESDTTERLNNNEVLISERDKAENQPWGISLVVQWLKLHVPNAGV